MKKTIFSDASPFILVEVGRRFRCTHCLHHQGETVSLKRQTTSTRLHGTIPHKTSYSPRWGHKISRPKTYLWNRLGLKIDVATLYRDWCSLLSSVSSSHWWDTTLKYVAIVLYQDSYVKYPCPRYSLSQITKKLRLMLRNSFLSNTVPKMIIRLELKLRNAWSGHSLIDDCEIRPDVIRLVTEARLYTNY
jgi:hypothetical protein